MKKKTIALFILASLYGATASAESLTLEESTNKVMQKMNELAELAKDPANVIQKGEQKYLSYKGKELRINFDGNIKFDLMAFHSEFNTVFDFIPSTWETYWYDGGFDIYPGKSDQCKFELFAAARGSKDNEGNYIWERPLSTVLTTTGCPDVTQKESIFFNTNTVTNDLSGNLAGAVLFAQAHIIPANANEQEKRMHLVGERKTKVMLKPENELDYYSTVTVTATDKAGQVLGEIEMKNPSQLAPNVLSMPELTTTNIDFSYDESKAFNVSTPTTEAIAAALVDHDTVVMRTWNGHWNRVFDLEQDNPKLDGKTFVFISSAGYNSHVNYYKDRSRTIVNGTTTVFKNVNGVWILQDDLIFNEIGYAQGYWSADLPKEWLKPGLALSFANGDKKGTLNSIKIGAPTELLINTIDVGMLVEPRGRFDFQKDKEAQREYFETAPVSKMIVNEYEPVQLTEVMLPDGTLLTDHDPSDGGWHGGTMRQRIGKELISIGINNANYGIYSSSGVGEGENPYIAAQLTAHNTRGMYNNGLQTHGGSGGAGMVTLDSSIGNEFSHEVGHNYGLGHYPGGFAGSIHRPADMPNSTWGWDSSKNVFIPNFSPINTGGESCLDGQCVPAFNGMFKYGSDAMAGGWAMYGAQRFTMYTPYSMYFIQKNLESKVVFDKTSSTGFRKWDEATQTMAEYTHRIENMEVTSVNPWDANETKIAALFENFDKVDLSTWNGHWARNMSVPAASEINKGKVFTFNSSAGYNSHLAINGQEMLVPYGSRLTFVSDGQTWVKDAPFESTKAVHPDKYGVPVTTLVGYYDPQAKLDSYIFPALHGAFGYVYSDDSADLIAGQCALEVETQSGSVLKYALKNNRRNADNMNKFHVNVATSDNPVSASVVCDGQVLDTRTIDAPKLAPIYTVQGGDAKARSAAAFFSAPVPRVEATRYEPQACNHADGEHNH
ncbi:TPA: M66 family metalloprotease [Photobacterium damselae]